MLQVMFDLSSNGHLRRSFRPPLLVGFPEGNQILYTPQPIRHASGHGWRRAKCTMNLDEIVGEIIEAVAAWFELLKPYDARLMLCYPVSTWINYVANDDEECSRPVELAEIQNKLFS